MTDTPGWASPGSAPSDGQEPGVPGAAQPPEQPSDQSGAHPSQPSKWSKEQPPPGQWTAPSPQDPAQAPPPPPPPPPGQGWGTPGAPGTPGPGNGGYTGWGTPPGGPGAPGGPGGYGWGAPNGPGGPGGWGSPWGGPPPAAKPGVIPLRPLGVGEILDGTVSTMRTYWRTVLGISLTVAVFTEILVVLLQGFVLDDSGAVDTLDDPSASTDEVLHALRDTLVGSGAVALITTLATIVATALLTTVTSRAVLGKPVSLTEAWQDARPQLLRLFGLTFLLPLIGGGLVAIGTLPGVLVAVSGPTDAGAALAVLGGLAGLVVAIWLLIRFSLASPALMLEKQSIRKALGRSVKLVRGSWWRVFGIQLLAMIIANIMASIVVIPFAVIAGVLSGDGFSGFFTGSGDFGWTYLIVSGIGSVIGSTLTFPVTAGVTVLLYIDQRIRREALDLDLARAAGVSGYDSDAPAAGS